MTEAADFDRVLLAIHMKAERGERLTKAERVAVWNDKLNALDKEIAPLLKAGNVRAAIDRAMTVLAAHSIGKCEFYDQLEDRIAALEATKPSAKTRRG